jgi:hypothetical protein
LNAKQKPHRGNLSPDDAAKTRREDDEQS